MLSVAVAGVPRVAPPWGLLRVRFTVFVSAALAFKIDTVNVLVVSPAANLSSPLAVW